MKLNKTLFLLSLAFHIVLRSQNLVPNPSFEDYNNRLQRGHSPISGCKHWFAAYGTGTDYYNRKINKGEAVPYNDLGKQEPLTGDAYAGFCLHWKYLEYLQVELTDTLKEGQKYKMEFYVSRAEKSIVSVSELGVLFTGNARKMIPEGGIVEKPDLVIKREHAYRNKDEWMKISAVFEAQGYEKFMVLGYFPYERAKNFSGFAHYYVDDVSLTAVENEDTEDAEPVVMEEPETPEVEEAPVLQPDPGKTVAFKFLQFDLSESIILPQSFEELDQLLIFMEGAPETKVIISGHTDKTGDEKKNALLSEARAKAVAQYLSERGLAPSRITYHGFGSSKPVADNNTEEGRQKNRRVEFVISE